MEKKQWVQHISGQGEKWEVVDARPPGLQNDFRPMEPHEWIVRARVGSDQYVNRWFALPKSEYRLCDPPEVWRDITEQCVPTWDQFMCGPNSIWNISVVMPSGNYTYRLRKVDLREHTAVPNWAFVVEQKVSG